MNNKWNHSPDYQSNSNDIESLAQEQRRTKSRVDARRIVAVSLILSGKSYREVAAFLRVSINAVQNYLVTHYDKMALEPAYKKKFLTYYNAVKNLP
jgi:DNA-binding NarL/FixJ family response regulator